MYQGAILPSQFSPFFVRRNELDIEEKQKSPKNSVCDGIVIIQTLPRSDFFLKTFAVVRK